MADVPGAAPGPAQAIFAEDRAGPGAAGSPRPEGRKAAGRPAEGRGAEDAG
ncbi:hypothetical protein ABT112_00330 [Streptomyces sp. NPDC002055]|uniref:hypothetical protein n=1 Tax=Streptomyces sp. NPDC002055 TaxID=3154534 RepID=UPI003324F990